MESWEQKVHTQEREQDGQEADNGHDGCFAASPPYGQALVKQSRKKKPGDQRPCLLRVPAPIPPPGILCPDGARDDPEGQERESESEALVIHIV